MILNLETTSLVKSSSWLFNEEVGSFRERCNGKEDNHASAHQEEQAMAANNTSLFGVIIMTIVFESR